ncbi:MAG: hypothetical protein QXW10_02410 [Candidatus Micrarchaeaceae archaeon]
MTIVFALKADGGIVIGADKMETYVMNSGEYLASVVNKIFPIGKNTLLGFSGNNKNEGTLINFLRHNSKELDNELWGTLNALKKNIRKMDLEVQCLLCGISSGDLSIVTLSADKKAHSFSIDLIPQQYDIAGEIGVGLNVLDSTIHPYLEYAKKIGKEIDIRDAEFLVYSAINNMTKSGATSIGKGIDLWTVRKSGNNVFVEQVDKRMMNDLFETAYAYYKKKLNSAIDEAIDVLRELRMSEKSEQLLRGEKSRSKSSN